MSYNSKPSARPTREFFEQDPRSALLRNICIAAIDASEVVLFSEGQDEDALAGLLDANMQLTSLGIEPGMHTIASDDPERDQKKLRLANDPVMAAEWLAGQVREAVVRSAGYTDSGSPMAVKEHDELDGEGGSFILVDLQAMGPKTKQFVSDFALLGVIRGFVDYEAGPTESL